MVVIIGNITIISPQDRSRFAGKGIPNTGAASAFRHSTFYLVCSRCSSPYKRVSEVLTLHYHFSLILRVVWEVFLEGEGCPVLGGGASQLLLPFLLGATNMRCAAPNCTFLRSIFSRFY